MSAVAGKAHEGAGEEGRGQIAAELKRFLRYLRPHAPRFALALLLVLGVSVLRISQPKFTQYAIDRHIVPRQPEGLQWLALLFLAVAALSFILQFLQTFLLESIGQRVMHRIRGELYRVTQRQEVAYFERQPAGRLMTGLTSDVEAVEEFFTAGVMDTIGGVVRIVVVAAIMLSMDVRLTLVTALTLPPLYVCMVWFNKRARRGYDRLRTALGRVNSLLQEHLAGSHVIQLYGREARALREFRRVNEEYRRTAERPIFHHAIFFPLLDIISSAGIALIVWYGGWRVLSGGPAHAGLSVGMLVAFVQYAPQLLQPLREITDRYHSLQGALVALRRLFRTLDLRPAISSPERPAGRGRAAGRVEFEHVWFAYAGEDWVLKDVSFTIEPGQSVAFVGHTGAGKTTITSLLMRLYDVQRGRVLLDGVDVREWDLRALRENFAPVLQDVALFSGTVESNIGCGRLGIGQERVRWAAREVRADHFIERFPDGYRTVIREGGAGLSVGQKQMLSLARALASHSALLVLDEATSAVDAETEHLMQEAAERVMRGRTTLVIAHRLVIVRRVDRIIVLHQGEVREQGTHPELLAARGIYWRLYSRARAAGPGRGR